MRVLVCAAMIACASSAAPAAGDSLVGRIKSEAAAVSDEMIRIRRAIHMNPELSGEEAETARLIAAHLREYGLQVETGIGGHGVTGLLRGGKPGPVVAYRADMDAVNSEVVGDPPYKSRVPGVKHVCGHDAHVAVGLGVASVLASVREDLPGTVNFIFQPAEETVQGARAMIASGVLDEPEVEAIFGLHTAPFQAGTIACPAGVGLSGWQAFEVELRGAERLPVVAQEVASALSAMSTVEMPMSPDAFAAMIDALLVDGGPYDRFTYVAIRNVDSGPGDGALTVQGMIRADGPESYASAIERLRDVVEGATKERARFEIKLDAERFPDMHSDAVLVKAAIAPIEAAIGKGNAVPMYASAPFFGEDFALFQQKIPGAMFFLGVANEEKDIRAFNHFPDYDIDEDALEVGAAAMASVLVDYLQKH